MAEARDNFGKVMELLVSAIPKNVIDIVEKQLKPVFSGFKPESYQYKLYSDAYTRIKETKSRTSNWLKLQLEFTKSVTDGFNARKIQGNNLQAQLNLFRANYYLTQIEVIATPQIDKTILMLIGNGRDFHIEPDYDHRFIRHAICLEDLWSPSLSLSMKLDFLESNGLIFFSKYVDRPLRNKIAHLDFEIDSNGNFKAGGKVINLAEKNGCIQWYFYSIEKVFYEETCQYFE